MKYRLLATVVFAALVGCIIVYAAEPEEEVKRGRPSLAGPAATKVEFRGEPRMKEVRKTALGTFVIYTGYHYGFSRVAKEPTSASGLDMALSILSSSFEIETPDGKLYETSRFPNPGYRTCFAGFVEHDERVFLALGGGIFEYIPAVGKDESYFKRVFEYQNVKSSGTGIRYETCGSFVCTENRRLSGIVVFHDGEWKLVRNSRRIYAPLQEWQQQGDILTLSYQVKSNKSERVTSEDEFELVKVRFDVSEPALLEEN